MSNYSLKDHMRAELANYANKPNFKPISIAERIEDLIVIYGSLRKLGEQLDIDHAYLWRLKSGDKHDPSDHVLRRLGLKRTVIYEQL